MSNNKNIERLFQEKLKNLEVSPNKKIWNNIEIQLKKKKRKVLPFWWFSGSVAAILVLILFLYPLSDDENQNINSDKIITTIPKKDIIKQTNIDSITSNKKPKEEILIAKEEKLFNNDVKNQKIGSKTQEKVEISKIRKPIKPILLAYNSFDINLDFSQEKPSLSFSKIIGEFEDSNKLNIEDFVKKEEQSKTKNPSLKKWSIGSAFAVLKSNSFTNTSPINANLAKSTNGENSFSYGVQIAYKINKKWTIQSGIHLQEMSYSNNQIAINPSSQSNPFSTEFTNGDAYSFDRNSTENLSLSSASFTSTNNSFGNLNQSFGYIEIPLELKYNFLKTTKFETQIVTGFSSLFLNKNEVNLNTENLSRNLQATNLNNINFSGNLGFDFNYLFNKNWSLNLNPMLKVQINTFSTDANGFAPFNLGVYSGIKYQF